ncbi:rhomboid family intramembrane serine protease [Cupriavidus sp.]|uniref:rhomboid family intramembrane serine protease n=1 Tax=Cupriavidus sp. TaxID=1873897 RepID=UPI0028BE7378|nr:rhomboid family intramembrane serine protease [Cupriavidus sp.]
MQTSQFMRAPAIGSRRSGAFHVRRFGSALLVRALLWLCFGGLGALLLLFSRGKPSPIVLGAGFFGLLILFEWSWGRHAPLRKPLLTVDAGGIGSTAFPRRRPHLRWAEIAAVAVRNLRGGPVIEVFPKPVPGARRRTPASFKIRLALMREADQQLAQALVTHHMRTAGVTVNNTLAAEQAFRAEMQALPHTWGLYALIALNVAIWLFTLTHGATLDATAPARLVEWGGNLAVLVQEGQWWRLLTATFLHSSLKHIGANMLVLFVLGKHVERFYGTRGFLLIYLGAGLVGSALSLHFGAQTAVSVGASGAVFGVGGALLAGVLRHRRLLPEGIHRQLTTDAAVMIGYSLVQGFLSTRVDNAGHVGGLIGGALIALCLPVRLDPARYARKLRRGLALAAAVAAVLVVGTAALAPRVPQAMRDGLAASRQIERAQKTFMTAFQGMQADNAATKAGRMTPEEADDRSRTVRAPALDQAVSELVRITLPPGDPRAPLVQDMTLLADLLREMARMPSVKDPRTGKPVAADPRRAAQIAVDIVRLTAQMKKRQS